MSHGHPSPRRRLQAVALAVMTPLSFLAFAAAASAPAVAGPVTTITVTTTTDVVADDGLCSLREAITAANSDTASGVLPGECVAGSAFDAVELAEATYTLASGILTVTAPLTVEGDADADGVGATIDAGHNSGVFLIDGETTLHALTISGGRGAETGGAIEVGPASLTIDGCTFTDNFPIASYGGFGGAIFAWGGSTTTVRRSTFHANGLNEGSSLEGGAIFSAYTATLDITQSTFDGNLARYGGAIESRGTTTIANSTFTGNRGWGGAGAMMVAGGTATISWSTITDNSSSWGSGIAAFGTGDAVVNLGSSIVAGNSGDRDLRIYIGEVDPFHSDGASVIGTIDPIATDFVIATDVTGVTDPMLGPLGDHGGPTETVVPETGSPAIDIAPGLAGSDQRGFSRPVGLASDSGAVEWRCWDGGSTVTTFTQLESLVNCYNALGDPGAYVIELEADVTYTGALPAFGNATAGRSLALHGHGHTLDAAQTGRVIDVAGSTTVSLDHVTITGGTGNEGAGIRTFGYLTITASTITGNAATFSGGGVNVVLGGSASIVDSTISGNTSLYAAGLFAGSRTTVSGSTFTGNAASDSGGGLMGYGPTSIVNSTVSGNTAGAFGGGIAAWDNTTTIMFTTVTGNSAPVGAGLDLYGDGVTFAHVGASIVTGNTGGSEIGIGPWPNDHYTSNGYNVLGGLGNGVGAFTATGDVTGVTDAGLAPLADNGGPTRTHLPLLASPARDRVTTPPAGAPTVDQRGTSRIDLAVADAGAVERNCTDESASATNEATYRRLASCFDAAKPSSGEHTISVDSSITFTSPGPTFDNPAEGVSLVVNGNGHELHGDGTGAVVTIEADTDVTIDGATITGGGGIDGAGVNNRGIATIIGSTISGNAATASGGGVLAAGTTTIDSSTISGNTAAVDGGGVKSTGTTAIVNSTLSGNAAQLGGGLATKGATSLAFTTVTANTAANGAGIASGDPQLGASTSVAASVIAGNVGGGAQVSLVGGGTNSFASGGYNVIGEVGAGIGSFTQAGDATGVASAGLGALADNGGPTLTHLPSADSPVVNRVRTGAGGGPLLDQRGVARPHFVYRDAGAVECNAPACNTDPDDDGLLSSVDNCPSVANPGQADLDHDGIGDACDADRDGDGQPDTTDNCTVVANADQVDADHDGIGDACDGDRDGDSQPDTTDNCPVTANADQADADHDGTGDACDASPYPAVFAPLVPSRYADTRSGQPTFDGQLAGGGSVRAGSVLHVPVGGRGRVPANATAAVLNLTAVGAAAPGFATVYPCSDTVPTASSLNFAVGSVDPNEITAQLSPAGEVCVFVSATVDLVVDVVDYLSDPASYAPVSPTRFADSREAPTFDGAHRATGVRRGGTTWEIPVAGRGPVPAGTAAAVLNVTVSEASAAGFVTVYPCGERPTASSLNHAPGQTVANELVAMLSASGTVCVFTQSDVHVIVDVVGYLGAATTYRPVVPARFADSREAPTFDGEQRATGARQHGTTWEIPVAGRGAVPAGSVAVVANVTVTGASGPGFATVYPCGELPTASSVNFAAGTTRANELVASLSATGTLCVFTSADTHVIVDVVGYQ